MNTYRKLSNSKTAIRSSQYGWYEVTTRARQDNSGGCGMAILALVGVATFILGLIGYIS